MVEKKEENYAHEPQEMLDLANEVYNLIVPIKKGLEVIVNTPDILSKFDSRIAELKVKSQEAAQEALQYKNCGDKKNAIVALKKKKLCDEEIEKSEENKEKILGEAKKQAGNLLSDPLFEGLKLAATDIKRGKQGKYKKNDAELKDEIDKYVVGAAPSKEDEDELLKELENLEQPK